MKLVLVVILAICVISCAQIVSKPLPSANGQVVDQFRLALEAVFGVGIRLQAFLQDEQNDNFLVSPISTTVIVAQLILGAEGEFRKQLVELLALPNSHVYENQRVTYYNRNKKNATFALPYSTLHIQLSNLLKALESDPNASKLFTLKQTNALFATNQGIAFKSDFRRNLRRFYDTQITYLDFKNKPQEALRVMNNWADRNTNGLIKNIVKEAPGPSTAAIFANAVYFKAKWEIPFSDVLNRRGPFSVSETKQVEVTYMTNFIEEIPYAESADYRMVCLPYQNEELGMYIILPKSDNPLKYKINNFAQTLKSREVLDTISKARRRDVVIKLPKMTVATSFSILDQLKKYRVYRRHNIKVNSTNVLDRLDDKVEAFKNFTADASEEVYLTNAADHDVHVSDIVQQVVIGVNEVGTEAAAVSASTIDYIGGSKNFVIDRPFIFFIRHEATSATLFWGTISNPLA